jgi:hypothetical protein
MTGAGGMAKAVPLMRDLPYPLPYFLVQQAEILLQNIPDRGDDAYQIRRFLGQVYAHGYEDGRMVAAVEAAHDAIARQASDA